MNTIPTISERELLLQLRDGKERAFTKLYDQFALQITSHLRYLLKSDELTSEVLQDTFLAVWEHRQNIDPEQSFKAYIYKIATNKTYNIFKKAAHDKAYRSHLLPIIEAGYNNIEAFINEKDNKEILADLMKNMPERQREIYLLHKIEGYSYKDISEKLGLSIGTVNTHILRANQYIKSQVLERHEFIPVIVGILIAPLV